jgi:Uma2 family endonuclease
VRTSKAAAVASDATWAGRRLSYDDFLREAPDDGRSREWVDGRVIELSPASERHQDLQGFLLALLRHWVEAKRLGVVLSQPFQMKTAPHLSGREPDVLFLATEHLDRLRENHLAGAADLAVEIVSPDTRARDTVDKLREYEEGGVREYWLVDHKPRRFEARVLDSDGRYRLLPPDAGGILRSQVLEGLWLKTDWLWQRPLPPLLSVLKEWKLIG